MLRRSDFLAEAVEALGIPVGVHRGRAEESTTRIDCGGADVVTSRAVADLVKLTRWSLPLARAGGRMLALKGERAVDQVAEHRAAMAKLGARDIGVVRCGAGYLSPPTTVVSATRDNSPSSRRATRNSERRGR